MQITSPKRLIYFPPSVRAKILEAVQDAEDDVLYAHVLIRKFEFLGIPELLRRELGAAKGIGKTRQERLIRGGMSVYMWPSFAQDILTNKKYLLDLGTAVSEINAMKINHWQQRENAYRQTTTSTLPYEPKPPKRLLFSHASLRSLRVLIKSWTEIPL